MTREVCEGKTHRPFPLSLPWRDLYLGQWIAARTLLIAFPLAGLFLTAYFAYDFPQHGRGNPLQRLSLTGIGLVGVSYLFLLVYYCVDPGFVDAAVGGYLSPAYQKGLSLFFTLAAGLSGTATAAIAIVWVQLSLVSTSTVPPLKLALLPTVLFGVALLYFVVVAILLAVLSLTPSGTQAVVGLLTMGTVLTTVTALVAGLRVLSLVSKSKRVRTFGPGDRARLRRIRNLLLAFVAAQICCAVGEFVVVFFPDQLSATGPLWVWMYVAYPGLLFNVAFVFILLALRRKKLPKDATTSATPSSAVPL